MSRPRRMSSCKQARWNSRGTQLGLAPRKPPDLSLNLPLTNSSTESCATNSSMVMPVSSMIFFILTQPRLMRTLPFRTVRWRSVSRWCVAAGTAKRWRRRPCLGTSTPAPISPKTVRASSVYSRAAFRLRLLVSGLAIPELLRLAQVPVQVCVRVALDDLLDHLHELAVGYLELGVPGLQVHACPQFPGHLDPVVPLLQQVAVPIVQREDTLLILCHGAGRLRTRLYLRRQSFRTHERQVVEIIHIYTFVFLTRCFTGPVSGESRLAGDGCLKFFTREGPLEGKPQLAQGPSGGAQRVVRHVLAHDEGALRNPYLAKLRRLTGIDDQSH